MRSSN